MSVQAVNSVQNIQKPVQSPIEPQKPSQKEGISDGTKLLLGSLAALAVGGGIYFATRGRGGKNITKNEPRVNIKEEMKNSKNGTLTKLVTVNSKDGKSSFNIEYQDGVLTKCTKKVDNKVEYIKNYEYMNGKVYKIYKTYKKEDKNFVDIKTFYHDINGKVFYKKNDRVPGYIFGEDE